MQREEEREMFGLLTDQGVGSVPWSPLAKGRLARPWGTRTARADTDPIGQTFFTDADKPIADAVQQAAQSRGVPMAQIALAWVLKNPVVAAPIVGAQSPTTCPTPSPHWTSGSPKRKSGPSNSRTPPASQPASEDRRRRLHVVGSRAGRAPTPFWSDPPRRFARKGRHPAHHLVSAV